MSSTDSVSSGTGFSKPPSPRPNPKIGLPSASPGRWAGGAYNNSPHPSSLPLPVFLNTQPSTSIPRETVVDSCIDIQGVQQPTNQLNDFTSSPGSSPRNSMNGAPTLPENSEQSSRDYPSPSSGRPSPNKKRTVSSQGGAPVYQPSSNAGSISPIRRSPPRKQRQKKGKTRSIDGACDVIPLSNQPTQDSPRTLSPTPSPVQSPAPVQHFPVRVHPSEIVMPTHSSPMPIPRLDVLQYAHYLPNTASIMMSPPSPPLYSAYPSPPRGVDLNQLSNDLRRLLNIIPSDPIAV